MSWTRTIIEALVAVALIVGFIFESWFISLEERIEEEIKEAIKRSKARKDKYGVYNPREGLMWR